jgi:hypothetical protein
VFNIYVLGHIEKELDEMKKVFHLAQVIVLEVIEPSFANPKKG